jgi:predicted Zn-dependent peptidase
MRTGGLARIVLVFVVALTALVTGCGRTYHAPISAVTSKLPLTLRHEQLANGMEVYLQEDHHAPIVAVSLWYHVGSRDDPEGRSGLAHLFEHLMFEGSKHVGAHLFERTLLRAGATDLNATTNNDRTEYHEVVPASQLDLAMWAESDRMGFTADVLDQASLDRARQIVKNEWREHFVDEPYGMAWQVADGAVFPEGHPYHRPAIGTPTDLDATTLDELRAFFARYYVPDNATLVLVGDFRTDDALALVHRYFDPIPRGMKPLVHWPRMPVALDKERTIDMVAGVERPMLLYEWPGPPCCGPTTAALDTAMTFVSGNLYSELATEEAEWVDAAQMASVVRMRYEEKELAGAIRLQIKLKPGSDFAAARQSVDRVLGRLAIGRFYRSSVLREAFSHAANIVFELESFGSRATSFNRYAQLTGNPLFATTMIDAFEVMDAEDVRTTFRDLVVQSNGIVVQVAPKDGAPRGGKLP